VYGRNSLAFWARRGKKIGIGQKGGVQSDGIHPDVLKGLGKEVKPGLRREVGGGSRRKVGILKKGNGLLNSLKKGGKRCPPIGRREKDAVF